MKYTAVDELSGYMQYLSAEDNRDSGSLIIYWPEPKREYFTCDINEHLIDEGKISPGHRLAFNEK